MTLTAEKITVTFAMLTAANMTRGTQIGIPNKGGSLKWKHLDFLEEADYDAIENYFLEKSNSALAADSGKTTVK